MGRCRISARRPRSGRKARQITRNFPSSAQADQPGGRDAYVRLLRHGPADLGLAIFIVNHPRTVATRLHEILQQFTTMPVELITAGMARCHDRFSAVCDAEQGWQDHRSHRLRLRRRRSGGVMRERGRRWHCNCSQAGHGGTSARVQSAIPLPGWPEDQRGSSFRSCSSSCRLSMLGDLGPGSMAPVLRLDFDSGQTPKSEAVR